MARKWESLRNILACISVSCVALAPLTVLLGLLIFMFSLLGMELFGGQLPSSTERSNFVTMLPSQYGYGAAVTVFQILTTENWNEVMYSVIRTHGKSSVLYFVVLICIGVFMVLNLFIAVLLDGFSQDSRKCDSTASMLPPLTPRTKRGVWVRRKDRALFLFPVQHELRHKVHALVSDPKFDYFILVCILFSSSMLAFQSPLEAPPSWMSTMDIVLTAIFLAEMLLKIVDLGFFLHPGSYLRDGWNILDFFVVLVSLLSLAFEDAKGLRALRTFRALRPLRLIRRNQGLQLVVNCILSSIPPVFNVLMVCVLFYIIFAMVFIGFFKGTFMNCVNVVENAVGSQSWPPLVTQFDWLHQPNHANTTLANSLAPLYNNSRRVVLDWLDCQGGAQGQWLNADRHFDNLLSAISSLFEIATTEQWLLIMNDALDATQVGSVPSKMSFPFATVIFVTFQMFGNFFVLNIFTGVIIDHYQKLKALQDGEALQSETQKMWLESFVTVLKQAKEVNPTPLLKHFTFLVRLRASGVRTWLRPFSATLLGRFVVG